MTTREIPPTAESDVSAIQEVSCRLLKYTALLLLFCSSLVAHATTIAQYDAMSPKAQSQLLDRLVQSSVDELAARGDSVESAKLFNIFSKGSGKKDFKSAIDLLRDGHGGQDIEIAQIFGINLSGYHIFVPLAFLRSVDSSSAGTGMTISRFMRIGHSDAAQYVTLLVKGSVEALEARGMKSDADKLYNFFNTGDGGKQFYKNLNTLWAADQKNAADPNNTKPLYDVEEAFAITAKQEGIVIPLSYLRSINKDFVPTAP